MALGTTNISTTLVGTTLGTSSRDVGTLCTHASINKWSKWKPIRLNKVSGITVSDLASVNYGLSPALTSSNYADVAGVKWVYNKPRGGGNPYYEPFRLGDFRNYDHEALPIISDIMLNVKANRTLLQSKVINCEVNPGGATMIGLNDVGSISTMYFGAVLMLNSYPYLITSSNNLADGGNNFSIDLNQTPLNTNTTVAMNYVLSSIKATTLTLVSSLVNPVFAPLPTSDTVVNETTLTTVTGLDVGVELLGIGTTYNPVPSDNIDIYTNTLDPVAFMTSGALFMKLKLENNTSNDVLIPSGIWEISANPSYFGTNTNKHAATAYDTSGNVLSNLTVPAMSSVYIVVGASSVLNKNGTISQSVSSGTTTDSTYMLFYKASGGATSTMITGEYSKFQAP